MTEIFEDTWALVTGASSGLGAEFARQLAARKTHLLLTARSEGALDALAGELRAQHGIETGVIACDLGAPGGADRLCAEVDRRGHAVRHLVSNAGFGSVGPFADSPAAREADMVRLNCEALVALSRHFLPSLVAAGAGGIIHVGSVAGVQPVPYMATYGATKAFVISFSLALAEEVRSSGVRVLALCPGPVPTGFQKAAGSKIATSQRRAVLAAEEVVKLGLAAYERGADLVIPGAINRLMSFSTRLVPRRMLLRTVAKMMKNKAPANAS